MVTPSRRPPGPGGGPRTVFAFWAILFLLAASQGQSGEPLELYKSLASLTQSTNSEPSRRAQPGRSPAEIPLHKIDTTTVKFRSTDDENTNADRFHALAPAQDNSAVRAPLARSRESSGLSALGSARLLQDWEVENIVLLATIDGAIHARDRKTGQERWSLGVPDSPMIETTHHRQNRSSPDELHPEDDYIFIVEPSKDGNLYIQHKDPKIGLQRLGITVRSLAAQTPQFVDNPPLVTIAEQESTLYMVDAASGNVLKQFNKQRTFINDETDHSCRRISGFELDDTACEPFGTLYLGRIQYTIVISSAITGENLCTIKYSEWTPNSRDGDLQSQYVAPLDSCHIQSYHNGRIIGLDNSKDSAKPYRFTHVLETPVARVFDVVRPLDNKDGSAPLVMLAQPVELPPFAQSRLWDNEMERSKVFVNKTETGDWYAMSELSYPGVTSYAALANLFLEPRAERNYLDFDEDSGDMIGVHVLSPAEGDLPVRLTISGPSPESDVAEAPSSALSPILPSQRPAFISNYWPNSKFVVFTMLIGAIFFVIGIIKKDTLALFIQDSLQRAGVQISVPDSEHEEQKLSKTDTAEPTPDPPVIKATDGTPSPTPTPRSRSQSYAKDLDLDTAAKGDDGNENSSDGESEDEGIKQAENGVGVADSNPELKKRRAKRGKRGGRNNKKKKTMRPEALDETETVVVTEVPTKDGMLQVGRLKINTKPDQCLGHGSNGTAVFPGTLDGREVAVKRLIRSATSLAAKEIKHLLSSDENAHVVRYFGKEESQHFTYIALDLFTASLDQLVEHPERYPTLVHMPLGFDVKDALRQITDGVQHLHSLKLVHRDIKPQNVLVRAVKSSRPTVGLRKLQFVISDFGLCKPLEDGPESTFAPTANHTAAGTTGWRAPELLVDSRASVAAPAATSSTGNSTNHSSDGTVVDPPTGRRATKAIDIFSLGCVYYYVMTHGLHPFDVGGTSLGRDLNIKQHNLSTDGLLLHEYQFEADELILRMLKHNPRERPDTTVILRHPYFWDADEKLEFLCDMSDCYEREKNSLSTSPDQPRAPEELRALEELKELEKLSPDVIGPSNDFHRSLPRSFINEMGKQRKYTGNKMVDLLRVIRNKKNHFHDLPEDVKDAMLGGSATGYYNFWAKRFPSLLINCHCHILNRDLVERFKLQKYYV